VGKLSVALVIVLAVLFLCEPLTWRAAAGAGWSSPACRSSPAHSSPGLPRPDEAGDGAAGREERMAKCSRGGPPKSLLFIGNSFTARNDLPGLIVRMAAARGKTLQHRLVSAGGASLRTHWNAGHALKAIEGGGYDAVVLQEQSTLPVKNAARMHENVRLFGTGIAATGARTVLYMTWARRARVLAGHYGRVHRRRPGPRRGGRPGRRGLAAVPPCSRPAGLA
jgi:hypothetical protein